MNITQLQKHRRKQAKLLPTYQGVYVLVDWFNAALYVGASIDSIRKRARRHLTSARSDLLSNQKMMTEEIAFIWFYPTVDREHTKMLEQHLIFTHDAHRPLMNSKVPEEDCICIVPEKSIIQLVPDCELERRRDPAEAYRHHLSMLGKLLEYVLTTKDNSDTRKALAVRHSLMEYHRAAFVLTRCAAEEDEDDE